MRTLRTPGRLPLGIAAAAAALALSACGGSSTTTPAAPATSGAAGSTSAGSAGAAAGVKLVQAGTLTTCTHLPYKPFQFEQGGQVVGFDVDMVDLVAKRLGLQQKVVDTPFETIKTGVDLNSGKCDIAAAGMTIKPARQQAMDFSMPYFDATQTLLAKKGSGIRSLDDVAGMRKKLGSQSGTTGEDYVKGKDLDPVSFETSEAELSGLKSGQVDVIVQDLPVVNEWLKDPANGNLEIVANLDTGEQYGFAVRKGYNPQLLKAIDETLTSARSDGTYDRIYTKWIGAKPKS